jgi:hypothetical protein
MQIKEMRNHIKYCLHEKEKAAPLFRNGFQIYKENFLLLNETLH